MCVCMCVRVHVCVCMCVCVCVCVLRGVQMSHVSVYVSHVSNDTAVVDLWIKGSVGKCPQHLEQNDRHRI